MRTSSAAIATLGVLFLLRIFVCWYGFDRIPGVPGYDEVLVNDPAVALSRGEGFAARSFEGTEIAEHYAHFPPLFILLQAATFRVAGLSPLALRFWPISFHLLGCVVLILILRVFWRRGWIDGWVLVAVASLALLDLATAWNARVGRMDSMAALLGLGAVALLLSGREEAPSVRRALVASTLIGLAMSTHPSAVFFWWTMVVLLFVSRRSLGWPVVLVSSILPGIMLAAIWCCVHGTHSWDTLAQFQRINLSRTDNSLPLQRWLNFLKSRDKVEFLHLGGMATALAIASWLGLLLRSALGARERVRLIQIWTAIAAGQLILAASLTGLLVQRTVVVFPLALIGLALALSGLDLRVRRVMTMALGLVLLVQVASLAAFVNQNRIERHLRDPAARFAGFPVPSRLPAGRTIAGPFDLWYYFAESGQRYRLLGANLPDDKAYWRADSARLQTYDVVIAFKGDKLLDQLDMPRRKVTIFRDYVHEYWICEKQ